MITFKEYLSEEDEDKIHKVVKQAAEAYMKHCKDWQDVEVPLYRLSSVRDGGSHPMRTRVPRKRELKSRGDTGDVQDVIFAQPSWDKFPDRQMSIFCSTTKEFAVGDIDDFGENLLMIFPFDGTAMAVTSNNDFNYIDVMRTFPGLGKSSIMYLADWVRGLYSEVTDKLTFDPFGDLLFALKKIFLKDGEFDPTCKGNEKYAAGFAALDDRDQESMRHLVMDFPKVLTPKNLEVRLAFPNTIDLPGNTREVWFSGKYLSIPKADYAKFVKQVQALQSGEELVEKPRPKSVTRAKATE